MIPFAEYELRSYLSQGGTNLLAPEVSFGTLTFKIYRLGKLRISKSGHGAIGIDSTNVQQFTINWRGGLPGVIDVEGQVINRDDGETFVRFNKDSEDLWKVF